MPLFLFTVSASHDKYIATGRHEPVWIGRILFKIFRFIRHIAFGSGPEVGRRQLDHRTNGSGCLISEFTNNECARHEYDNRNEKDAIT
jgi:hypothetical protein